MMLASIAGPDILIVVAVLVLLFGASQLPKLARSLGSASHEFKKAHEEGEHHAVVATPATPAVVPAAPAVTPTIPVTDDSDTSIMAPGPEHGAVVPPQHVR